MPGKCSPAAGAGQEHGTGPGAVRCLNELLVRETMSAGVCIIYALTAVLFAICILHYPPSDCTDILSSVLAACNDFFLLFLAYEQYVERQFNKKIKNFHSDGGGEFVNSRLSSHFLAT